MSKNFLFVAGDIGAARMQAPVIRTLRDRGHDVSVMADAQGRAGDAFDAEGIAHIRVGDPYSIHNTVRWHDLTIIGTSASAQQLEWAAWSASSERKVLVSDGYFNHGLWPWRDVQAGIWLAIDEGHAQAIRERRPDMRPNDVRVAGQPAFDAALAMEPQKREIRTRFRSGLGFGDEDTVHVWWSQGMPQLIGEDLAFLRAALSHPQAKRPVLIPRYHPKLNVISSSFVEETGRQVTKLAREHGFRVVSPGGLSGEEICLIADVILSVTCTEDIKSTLIGGPTVVHFMGPVVRAWYETELGLCAPYYLPDVRMGLAYAAWTEADVPDGIRSALQRPPLRMINEDALRPATERVVQALLQLAA